jgi:glucose-1-phosphate cytidylyltransferase
MTGGRIKRVAKYLDDETFMLTYGDGVGDINIKELVEFHKNHGKLATVTATQPEGRFGALKLENNKVVSFAEKMDNKDSWINGGFFVLEPEVINYIKDDNTIWEREPLEKLSKDGELMAYFHNGFWKPMDKLKDKMELEEMWDSGNAPWKIWGE